MSKSFLKNFSHIYVYIIHTYVKEMDANGNAIAIQMIKLENEGWQRDVEVVEPSEPSFTEPA